MDVIYTQEDFDAVMKANPHLKKQYEEILLFIELNPELAKEVERRIREYINR